MFAETEFPFKPRRISPLPAKKGDAMSLIKRAFQEAEKWLKDHPETVKQARFILRLVSLNFL